jgi:hypothetical protein
MSLMWHQYRKHVNMKVNTPHPPTHPTPYYRVKHYVAKRQNARMCAPTRSVFDPEAKTYIKPIYRYCYLLVGGLEDVDTFSIFPYIGNVIIPSDINWLSYFSEGLKHQACEAKAHLSRFTVPGVSLETGRPRRLGNDRFTQPMRLGREDPWSTAICGGIQTSKKWSTVERIMDFRQVITIGKISHVVWWRLIANVWR